MSRTQSTASNRENAAVDETSRRSDTTTAFVCAPTGTLNSEGTVNDEPKRTVLVLGGGVGGTVAAVELKKHLGDSVRAELVHPPQQDRRVGCARDPTLFARLPGAGR